MEAAQPGAHRRRAGAILVAGLSLLAGGVLPATATAATKAGPAASYRTQSLPSGTTLGQAASVSGTHAPRIRITLHADRRFSLAALRWNSGAPIAGRLRAKQANGHWSPWSTLDSQQAGADGVTEGDDPRAAAAAAKRTATLGRQGSTEPIWTGPARTLQVELTGKRPAGLRAAFVDVTGTPRTTARAARQVDQVAGIQPRSAWDPNNECAPRATADTGSVQAVVVHHTAGSNEYTQAQVPAVLLAICKYHRNSNGWNDIGYNVLVDKYGGAWEGRAGGLTNAVIGAHAQGFNSVTAGVSMLGDFTSIAPSPEQLATVARVAAWKLAVAGVPRTGTVALTSAGGSLSRYGAGSVVTLPRVVGHRDVGQTACPGNVGYTTLDGVRAAVAAANPTLPTTLPAALAPAPVPVAISISTNKRVASGTASVVRGAVRQGSSRLPGATVALQVGGNAAWQTLETSRTDRTGKYQFKRKFSRSWGVRVVRTDGDGGTSTAVKVALIPRLTLTVPARLSQGRSLTLKGTIAPGRGPVTLEVWRRSASGKYIRGQDQRVTVTGRKLTVRIKPNSAALYRFRVVYAGTKLAATARSKFAFGRSVTTGGASSSASGGISLSD